MTAIPLRAVIGAGIRRVRQRAGRTQDDIGRAARSFGLTWDRAKVASLERGDKAVSADELLLLPVILRAAGVRAVSLSDLIDQPVKVELTGGTCVMASDLADLLTGGSAMRAAPQRTSLSGEAEYKASRRLGQPIEAITAAALELWGRSLTEERNARLDEQSASDDARTVQAKRGHITRQLLAELQERLE